MLTKNELIKARLHPKRVTIINECDGFQLGRYVLYWMQSSVRERNNCALEYAIAVANKLNLPVLVCYVLVESYPGAMFRHYHFLAEGLQDVAGALEKRGVKLIVRLGKPENVVLKLAKEASMLVTDCAYLKILRRWRQNIYNEIKCPAVEVEDNVVVPVEVVSNKQEYAARTIRPKITKHIDEFSQLPVCHKLKVSSTKMRVKSLEISGLGKCIGDFAAKCKGGNGKFIGGQTPAKKLLDDFVDKKLCNYSKRNDPNADCVSKLSPYIHLGMLNPVEVMLAARGKTNAEDFIEQLVVRRELAINFAYYNPDCKSYESAVPDWAKAVLEKHTSDKRPYLYTFEQIENAQTHDPAWNAAQMQMVNTGYMHGYMRMYWGKKVIEWTKSPQEAFSILVELNDKYELDGRDANGYTGIAWCFGTHDRPWASRSVFGTVRYMNYQGLKRKFDIEQYCRDNIDQ